jgi:hypothetical protein
MAVFSFRKVVALYRMLCMFAAVLIRSFPGCPRCVSYPALDEVAKEVDDDIASCHHPPESIALLRAHYPRHFLVFRRGCGASKQCCDVALGIHLAKTSFKGLDVYSKAQTQVSRNWSIVVIVRRVPIVPQPGENVRIGNQGGSITRSYLVIATDVGRSST